MKKIILILSLIFFMGVGSAAFSEPSYCCEKSITGGVCLNLPESQCASGFQKAPTSCESTSFCKLGTCYDSKEGICMENVPQATCNDNGGTWSEKGAGELLFCNLGCCIIADQAAFVSLARCKKLSTNYGLEMDYRSSVASEVTCIALANSQDSGACVTYESSGINTCTFTTRKECDALDGVIALNVETSPLEQNGEKRFYKDVLCSAEELSTDSARQTKTGCYKGMVYWFDDKGNRENTYSSNKDKSWNNGRVLDPDSICDPTGGSKDCGNCDYLLGSVCSEWSGSFSIGKPKFGNYFCKKTTCKVGNKEWKNGESWCVYDSEPGTGIEKVGSRHFRQICIDGEVVTDPCDDFRNEICIHSGLDTSQGVFSTAVCRKNRWQDCSSQFLKRDCENIDARDCIWVDRPQGINMGSTNQGSGSMSNPSTNTQFSNPTNSLDQTMGLVQTVNSASGLLTGGAIVSIVDSGKGRWESDFDLLNKVGKFNRSEEEEGGLCVPLVPPGTKFWEGGGSCSMASATCEVKITVIETKNTLTGAKQKEYSMEENDCLKEVKGKKNVYEPIFEWASQVNAICSSIGDCGANININEKYTDWGYLWKYENDTFSLQGNIKDRLNIIGTGNVVKTITNEYIINDDINVGENSYVLVKR